MKRDEFMDLVGANYVDEYEKAQLSREDATSSTSSTADTISRQFEEIVVRYPPVDLCNYPEYKGKPYYSIKYIEDGECFVGFGTYKPEVLSQYLRDYFMPSAQPKKRTEKRTKTHACDLISRQAAIDALRICDNNEDGINCHKCPLRDDRWDGAWQDEDGITCYRQLMRDSAVLLSAQPERKKGKWIKNDNGTYSCSLCHSWIPEEQHYYAQFCLYCGADMRGE